MPSYINEFYFKCISFFFSILFINQWLIQRRAKLFLFSYITRMMFDVYCSRHFCERTIGALLFQQWDLAAFSRWNWRTITRNDPYLKWLFISESLRTVY